MKIEKLTREFLFKGKPLEDPNPKMTIDQVRSFYSNELPELVNATWQETPEGTNVKVEFKIAVGKKG